jgi:hypothetical protein
MQQREKDMPTFSYTDGVNYLVFVYTKYGKTRWKSTNT